MTDWYLVSVIVFAAILGLVLWKDRKNVKRESIFILRKTKRGRDALIKIGTSFPRFWKFIGMLAIFIGFAVSVFFMGYLCSTLYDMSTAEGPPQAAVGFLLPTPTAEPVLLPGVVGTPFWYWIIAIALLVLFHEGMHGIMTAREKLRIKSMGWGLLFLVPLAFVEPDEKALVKRPAWQQLRIFAVGSFGNFVLAGISLAVLFLFMVSMYVPGGVSYSAYIPGYPAEQVNLTGVIRSMDGFQIRNITDLSLALEEIGPGKEIAIGTRIYYNNYTYDDLTYTLTTAQDNETGAGFIGISFNPASVNFYELQPSLWDWRHQIDFLEGLFQWLFIINLGVGSVNLLPIGPLDGGRMWQLVFKRLSKKRWKFIANAVSKVTLALLVLNFAVPILRSALGI